MIIMIINFIINYTDIKNMIKEKMNKCQKVHEIS